MRGGGEGSDRVRTETSAAKWLRLAVPGAGSCGGAVLPLPLQASLPGEEAAARGAVADPSFQLLTLWLPLISCTAGQPARRGGGGGPGHAACVRRLRQGRQSPAPARWAWLLTGGAGGGVGQRGLAVEAGMMGGGGAGILQGRPSRSLTCLALFPINTCIHTPLSLTHTHTQHTSAAKGKAAAAAQKQPEKPQVEVPVVMGCDTPCHRAGIRAYRASIAQVRVHTEWACMCVCVCACACAHVWGCLLPRCPPALPSAVCWPRIICAAPQPPHPPAARRVAPLSRWSLPCVLSLVR